MNNMFHGKGSVFNSIMSIRWLSTYFEMSVTFKEQQSAYTPNSVKINYRNPTIFNFCQGGCLTFWHQYRWTRAMTHCKNLHDHKIDHLVSTIMSMTRSWQKMLGLLKRLRYVRNPGLPFTAYSFKFISFYFICQLQQDIHVHKKLSLFR